MIKYDKEYYKCVMKKFNYKKISPFLNIDKFDAEKNWICSYNLDKFINGINNNEKSIVIMGIGINGIPHFGTIAQLLKVIYLQQMGLEVQIVLGDLDVYGARSTPLEEINKLLGKYRKFIISLGFDIKKGTIRNQYDYPEILRTSFLLASCLRDKDFDEIEEDINDLYKTERVYEGMDYNVKQAISLMFADFIHPGLVNNYKHVLIMSGIDEHGYVWKAGQIVKDMNINMTISGLYSKMLRGLKKYPKMSKSIRDSVLDVESSKKEIESVLKSELYNYDSADNSYVYQLMKSISYYDKKQLIKLKKDCNFKNEEWLTDVNKYIEDLYNICQKWR